jgi:hypothetical protein
MSDGVIYQMTGARHANHLIVSVMALRRVWDGPVTILAGDPPAIEIARKIKADSRLVDIEVVEMELATKKNSRKRNMHYMNKTRLLELSPYDRTVFLDADTLPVAPFLEMFPLDGFIYLTKMVDWKTTGRMMRKRIEAWRKFVPVDVALMLGHDLPAINTGVIGFTKSTAPFFEEWRELTSKNICFMCDELSAQVIYYRYPHTLMNDKFNCSAPHSHNPDPRIWHGHGFKFVKTAKGRDIWMPYYERAMADNIAGITDLERIDKAPRPWIETNVPASERKEYSPIPKNHQSQA